MVMAAQVASMHGGNKVLVLESQVSLAWMSFRKAPEPSTHKQSIGWDQMLKCSSVRLDVSTRAGCPGSHVGEEGLAGACSACSGTSNLHKSLASRNNELQASTNSEVRIMSSSVLERRVVPSFRSVYSGRAVLHGRVGVLQSCNYFQGQLQGAGRRNTAFQMCNDFQGRFKQ